MIATEAAAAAAEEEYEEYEEYDTNINILNSNCLVKVSHDRLKTEQVLTSQ